MMRNSIEIYDHSPKGKGKNVGSNYFDVNEWRYFHHGGCSDPGIRTVPSQPEETRINNAVKKLRVDGSTQCLLDCLPEATLHDILSRLSICDLLRARRTCVAWHRIISSSNIFQRLYDGRNQDSWIALTSDPHNPHDFCLLNNKSNKWYFLQARHHADLTKCWLLHGAADGLMLFVSSEGKMVVSNALTTRFQLLPDTMVSQRLRLQSCLKKKLWGSNSTPTCVQPSMSINIVVDAAGKTFKVMVWGELRSTQVHALVYSSSTDKWTVRLCSNVDYKLFRRPFHSTLDDNTIFYSSINRSLLASYNTETGLFVVRQRILQLPQLVLRMVVERVQNIKMMIYKSRIFLLGAIIGRKANVGHSLSLMGLWQSNPSGGQWELLTTHELQFPSYELAAAYDGKNNIMIIPRREGLKMIVLNLDTKEWRMSDADTEAWKLSDGNARNPMITSSPTFRAFHLKLKFCTAI
jgi:hypothetical protein